MHSGDRLVARCEVERLIVSTIFLAVDHNDGPDGPPILYETMVFVFKNGGWTKADDFATLRYKTRNEALAGHADMVHYVREQQFIAADLRDMLADVEGL